MSCLRPLTIINPAKKVGILGGHRFTLSVPCGQCSECKKRLNNEWYFRAYYETKVTLDKGGFVLFDTLTYSPKCLPHLHHHFKDVPKLLDFPCFNRMDVRHFFMRLRSRLMYLGFDVADNLKYFLSSEYGTDPTKTHAPHYHVLFYSTIPNLDCLTLSYAISDSWQFGRTDGAKYNGGLYVKNKRVVTSDAGFPAIQGVCKYVTKYVMKDSEFEEQINNRLVSLCKLRELDPVSFDGRKFLRDVRRVACQFHLQSKGFGAAFLKYNSVEDVFENGVIRVPDSISTLRFLPLPMYYRRKIFYDMVKDFRGARCWKLNQLGIAWKVDRIRDGVIKLAQRFTDWFNNIPNYVNPSFVNGVYNYVDELLDGRSFMEFATYVSLFKGVVHDGVLNMPPTLDTWVSALYSEPMPSFELYNYSNMYDRHHFGMTFLSSHFIGDNTMGYSDDTDYITTITLHDFKRLYVINENTYFQFRNFDRLFELYCMSLIQYNINRESVFNYVEHLKRIYKQFY